MGELCCPTCGHAVHDVPMAALADVKLSPQLRTMLQSLVRVYPRFMERDRLFDDLYAFDPNGGPDNIAVNIGVRMYHLRRSIEPFGWTVSNARYGRGVKGRYRLQKIEPPAYSDADVQAISNAIVIDRISRIKARGRKAKMAG